MAACLKSPESVSEDYLVRLATVLGEATTDNVNPDSATLPSAVVFPRRADLKVSLEPGNTLSIREFLSIRECTLHSALANKNSQLGRLASASQALILDLRILHHGPACVRTLEQQKRFDLAEKLTSALQIKRAGIKVSLWQTLIAGDEARAFWAQNASFTDYPHRVDTETETAIRWLSNFATQVLRGNYLLSDTQASALERHLGKVRLGDGGLLRKEFAQLNSNLAKGDQVIGSALSRPLCLNHAPTSRAKNFQNVVTLYFIPQVQHRAVALRQRYQQLLPSWRELEALFTDIAPAEYSLWQQQRDAAFARGLSATQRHVQHIQKIYAQCGLQAG